MRGKYKYQLNKINWYYEEEKVIPIDQMEELICWYEENGIPATQKRDRSLWLEDNTYMVEKVGYWYRLYVHKDRKNIKYSSNWFDDTRNIPLTKSSKRVENQGTEANKVETSLFLEYNGVTPREAFGYAEQELLRCVPKQFYYINERYKDKNLKHISKADFSSHYPSNMKGHMPDIRRQKRVKGTIKPTEEYPFAFYVKSGHSAEFGVYDTHDWLNEKINSWLFGENIKYVPLDEDETILCKPSDYTYDKVVDTIYGAKAKGELFRGLDPKLIMNASIGYKHLRNSNRNRLYHIAIVTLCRANQKMLNIYKSMPYGVLQIIVDGIIYMGKDPIGTESKELGQLHQEVLDSDFRMRGANQYIFIKDGICVDFCHSGFNDNIETNCLEDIKNWRRKENG